MIDDGWSKEVLSMNIILVSLSKATTTIEVGDRLICHGNLQNLGRLFDTPGDDPKSAS